jgi:hypothetical protein
MRGLQEINQANDELYEKVKHIQVSVAPDWVTQINALSSRVWELESQLRLKNKEKMSELKKFEAKIIDLLDDFTVLRNEFEK